MNARTTPVEPLAPDLGRRCVAELLGTALLLVAIVGSGIMGERLAGGNAGLALLANSVASASALVVLILVFGPLSGAHFNPWVTVVTAIRRDFPGREIAPYVAAQLAGAFLGVVAAHGMFGEPLLMASRHARSGFALVFAEGVATFGLVATILGCSRSRPSAVPFAVGGYILAAYWFTSSTSFANPAVTLARTVTDTFAGIRPADAPGFLIGQLFGAAAATAVFGWLEPSPAGETT